MTYVEFKRQLGKAALTAKEFAQLVKLNVNSITNYSKSNEVPTHLAIIAALIGEMAEKKVDFKAVLRNLEISTNRARGKNIVQPTKKELQGGGA